MDDDNLSESHSIVVKEENILNKVYKGKGGYLTEENICFRSETRNTKAAETKIYDQIIQRRSLKMNFYRLFKKG